MKFTPSCETWWLRPLALARMVALRFVVPVGLVACNDPAPPSGGLVVVVESDLSIPKDMDKIRLEVRQGQEVLRSEEHMIGQDQLHIPAEFRVRAVGNNAPVLIRATAFKRDESRIERHAITPIPPGHIGLLRLPFNYLCKGFVDSFGGSSCESGKTCKLGECVDSAIAASDLPRYDVQTGTAASGVVGNGSGDGQDGERSALSDECFDVLSCFANYRVIDVSGSDCSFVLPDGTDADRLNVALALPPANDGICDVEGCWVALDRGEDGWSLDGELVRLPRSICVDRPDGVAYAVAVSSSCVAKRRETPPCGSWSSASEPIRADSATDLPPPAIGDSCAGRPSEACGRCGTRTRTCRNGSWSQWSECSAEGECDAGSMQACGNQGTQLCNDLCGWDECSGQACDDGPVTQACGRCGTQTRACENGTWGEWSACSHEGECAPDQVRDCGTGGTQVCGGNCSFGDCGDQVCPGAPSEACGRCGTRSRACDPDTGTWSEWSACSNQGPCDPNAVRACGSGGTQVCGGDCQWDAQCGNQQCDEPLTQACGNCGVQARRCDPSTGDPGDWSACSDRGGSCTPGATRPCGGGNGLQTCGSDCRWSAECAVVCAGPFTQACGNCGMQSRGCDLAAGAEGPWSACRPQGACMPGTPRPCGADGSGTQVCGDDCQWPTSCECPANALLTQACGRCGTQTRTCTARGLSEWSACANQGACEAGAVDTLGCGGAGSGAQRTCSDTCEWNACQYDCRQIETRRACGNCGVQFRYCYTDTGPDPWLPCAEGCAPQSTRDCTLVATGGAGVQTCSAACEWGECGCPASQTLCPWGCTDTNTNSGACGSCDIQCFGMSTCTGGRCVCPAPYRACGPVSICLDVQSDPANCGDCDRVCADGMTCSAGQCVCPAGTEPTPGGGCRAPCLLTTCGDLCVDTTSDALNCGACGVVCPFGCFNSACIEPN